MKGHLRFTVLGHELWRIEAEGDLPPATPTLLDPLKDVAAGGLQKAFTTVGKALFR